MEEVSSRNEAPALSGLKGHLNGWMTLNSAAKALGCTRYTVLVRCVAREIEAEVFAGQVMVSTESVDRLRTTARSHATAAA